MNRLPGGRSRFLLFRTYLFLAVGLLAVAFLLDLGFGYLQSTQEPDVDPWVEATLRMIEHDLATAPVEERASALQALRGNVGYEIQLLQQDEVVVSGASPHGIAVAMDADGNTTYLHDAESIGAIIRLGPVPAPRESWALRLLPPVFYLSIFVVVGIWLRPLLRDINLIADGTQRFAADYREPLTTAASTSELTDLAQNIDAMSARLSALIRSQKELIAALSHEMRTPLARIRFALAVMGNTDNPELTKKLEAVNDDLQEIDDLIASMLNYARLDHPDIRMHWQAVPLAPWLDKVVGKSRTDGVEVTVDTDEAPDEVWMDSRLMELALSNLIVNACRYGDGALHCSAATHGDHYLLTVEDNGAGIPAEERDAVFKAFTRIDDSRNRETGGYGLGLAIVARIAVLHGGSAEVRQSQALGGACFSVEWPARH